MASNTGFTKSTILSARFNLSKITGCCCTASRAAATPARTSRIRVAIPSIANLNFTLRPLTACVLGVYHNHSINLMNLPAISMLDLSPASLDKYSTGPNSWGDTSVFKDTLLSTTLMASMVHGLPLPLVSDQESSEHHVASSHILLPAYLFFLFEPLLLHTRPIYVDLELQLALGPLVSKFNFNL